MTLFQQGNFTLHSGQKSWFKIDCDALRSSDWEVLARLVHQNFRFRQVIGVPGGGLKFARVLHHYCEEDETLPTLIVDDVLTTGASMEKARTECGASIGIVVFSRGECPDWVFPLFRMEVKG